MGAKAVSVAVRISTIVRTHSVQLSRQPVSGRFHRRDRPPAIAADAPVPMAVRGRLA